VFHVILACYSFLLFAQEFADKLGIPFIETSAVESINVEEAFMRITKDLIGSKYVLSLLMPLLFPSHPFLLTSYLSFVTAGVATRQAAAVLAWTVGARLPSGFRRRCPLTKRRLAVAGAELCCTFVPLIWHSTPSFPACIVLKLVILGGKIGSISAR